jgi:hypothetical protein
LVGIAVSAAVETPVGSVGGVPVAVALLVGDVLGIAVVVGDAVSVTNGVMVAVPVTVAVSVTVGVKVTVGVLVGGGPAQLLAPDTIDPLANEPDALKLAKLGPEIGPMLSQFGCAPAGGGGGLRSVGPPELEGPPLLTL